MHRPTKSNPGPEPLREILARLITARGWGQRQTRLHLERAWAAALGPEHEAGTRVLGLRRGLFEVEVNNAVLMQELASFQKRKLLAKLRECLPNHTVNDLRFRAATW